jgi:hypothetical protein
VRGKVGAHCRQRLLGAPAGSACWERFFSAVNLPTTWRRRSTKAASDWLASVGKGRGSGWMASAKCASTAASSASVFASCPVALAKSRTWRGLTTARGKPASASRQAQEPLRPAVPSRPWPPGQSTLALVCAAA